MSDYDVGYGKPPKHSQFKKGQPSANPNGRPKGSKAKGIKGELDRQVVVVTKNGRKTKKSARDLLYRTLTNAALQGDRHAQTLVVKLDAEAEKEEARAKAVRAEQKREWSDLPSPEEARRKIAEWLREERGATVSTGDDVVKEAIRLGIFEGSPTGPTMADWAREAAEARLAKRSAPPLLITARPVEASDVEQYALL